MVMADLAMSHPAMSAANINMQLSSSMHVHPANSKSPDDGTNGVAVGTSHDAYGAFTHANTAGDTGTSSTVPEWTNVFVRFGFDFNDAENGTQGDAGGTTQAGDYDTAYGVGTGATGGDDFL